MSLASVKSRLVLPFWCQLVLHGCCCTDHLATTFISYISISAYFILHIAVAFDNLNYRNEIKNENEVVQLEQSGVCVDNELGDF